MTVEAPFASYLNITENVTMKIQRTFLGFTSENLEATAGTSLHQVSSHSFDDLSHLPCDLTTYPIQVSGQQVRV